MQLQRSSPNILQHSNTSVIINPTVCSSRAEVRNIVTGHTYLVQALQLVGTFRSISLNQFLVLTKI